MGTDLDVIESDGGELVERTFEEEQEEIAARISDAQVEIARLVSEASAIAEEDVAGEASGQALVPSTGTAAAAKRQIAGLRARAVRQQVAVEAKRSEIKGRQREIEDLMQRQMDIAMRALAPLQKFVARLEEGIWMVNLYLGRDEEIVLLRDGEPAPAGTIVTIRQLVLAMDEECAVNPDDDGIDATNIEAFDDWLKSSPAHVDQVAPEPKCIVALRPRFVGKNYEDPWKKRAVDEANQKTYFLIRNGDRLFRTWTEFNAGVRLVPTADEFSSYFYDRPTGMMSRGAFESSRKGHAHRVPITPGTDAWERAEEDADAQQRHYMRVGLILQGLADRTTVLHPLPEGGISFMDHEQGGVTWRFLSNAERALTTGRQPFYEWLDEKVSQVEVGMRIVGSFTRFYSRNNDPYEFRISPRGAERPPSGELLTVEERLTASSFIVRYKRTEKIYDRTLWVESPDRPGWGHRGGYKEPKRRASCQIVGEEHNFLPFDLVTEDEMVTYLNARLDRHAYADMFPLLKKAIRAKREEREVEQPFRTMLAGVLARDNGVTVEEAIGALDSLIEWWKLTNKNHRPIVGDEEAQTKAVRMLVAEHGRRVKAEAAGAKSEVVQTILRLYPQSILVARKRSGRYTALVPENDQDVFVREVEFTTRGVEITHGRWQLVKKARFVRWMILHRTARFDGWKIDASLSDHLTGPEFEPLSEEVMADRQGVMAIAYDATSREFHTWRLADSAVVSPDRPVTGKLSEPKIEHVERKWRRAGVGAPPILGREHTSYRGEHGDQVSPWDTRRPATSYWGEVKENRYVVLFEDPVVVARAAAEKGRYEAGRERRSKLNILVTNLLGSIEKAWVERKEREEFDRFLEDYLDPELWEGHKKTLPRDALAYPYTHWSHSTSFSDGRDALCWLVTYAVEQGVSFDLHGLTVWEAAEKHFPPASYTGKPDDIEVISVGSGASRLRKGRAPEPIDIQEDLRELRFVVAAPEPDEDEEECDDVQG